MLEEIVKILTNIGKTISVMESCTGGGLANEITNISGSSEVFKFGAVAYANYFKEKLGVSKDIIDKYSVYSMETAVDMAKKICLFSDSNIGIGITGKLNRVDSHNLYGDDNIVYFSIYNKDSDVSYNDYIRVNKLVRKDNKKDVIDKVLDKLYEILKKETLK